MLFAHFEEIAGAGLLPVVVYNNPLYTGNNLHPSLIAALMALENVIGLKQSNDDLGQLVESLRLSEPTGRSLCTGVDSQFYAALCVGAKGIFSTAAAIVPAQIVRLYDLAQDGDHDGAAAQHRLLQPLNRFLEYDPGYVSPTKEALGMMGVSLRACSASATGLSRRRAARTRNRPDRARCARTERSGRVRLVTFEHDGRRAVGAVDGEAVVDLAFPGDMVAFVAGGEQSLAWAERKLAEPGDDAYPLADVRLRAPIVPPVILNSGQNYWDHRDEKPDVDQKEPEFFLKTPLAVIGPEESILYDSIVTRKLDYEVELAVVIGKPGRHIPVENALDHVFGYTVANDITARDRQAVPHPEGGFEYALGPGKNFDTSAPLGPWIVTRDEIPDPQNLQLRTYVNDEVRQSNSTAKMIWSVAEIVAFFSHFYTLQPGVLLETGTPGGTAWATDPEIGGKPFERDDVDPQGLPPGRRRRSRGDRGHRIPLEPDRRGASAADPRRSQVSLLIPDAPTLLLNCRLIDGHGGEPVETAPSRWRAT